jgi:3-isopropylmalate/(R)-2-methylmalate dehydratase small subunit
MPVFTKLTSRVVALPVNDIDTDQIIPARFLKATDKEGLGKSLFADWRYLADGAPRPDFVLNRPEVEGVRILVAGHNFGCGSSREHAPWALVGFGFRAIVATSFADIFKNNALKNGLLPVTVEPAAHARILAAHSANPAVELTVDLEAQTVTLAGDAPVSFPVDPFARHCLLQGVDELGYLLSKEDAIRAYEARALEEAGHV